MLFSVAAHSAHRTHLHRIQHRRNGSHIILAQQQPQQPHKMLRLPYAFAQNVIHLLQRTQQDLPELIEDLRAAVVAGGIQFRSQLRKTVLQIQIHQEPIQRNHLLMQVLRIQKTPAELLQRHHSRDSAFIEPFDLPLGLLAPDSA